MVFKYLYLQVMIMGQSKETQVKNEIIQAINQADKSWLYTKQIQDRVNAASATTNKYINQLLDEEKIQVKDQIGQYTLYETTN